MVKKFSEKAVGCLADNRVIEKEDAGIYEYGLSILIYALVNLSTIFLIGGILGCIPESLCYMICYIILRKFTGGYHAHTPVTCYLISTFMFFVSIYTVHLSVINSYLLIVVLILAVVCSRIVPVDTENKKLSSKEKKVYRIVSLIVFTTEISVGIIAYGFHFRMLYDSIILAVLCCELLAFAGWFANRRSVSMESESVQP